jgi:hypothetical protein
MSGVPSSKDDIDGSHVSDVLYREEGGINRIATYCNKDVICTAKIFLAMQGKANFIEEVVDKTGTVAEKPKELGYLQEIAKFKVITEEQQIALITKIKKMKKSDRLNEVELVKTALGDNAPMYEAFLNTINK